MIYQGNGSLEQMQTFSTIYPKLRQLDQKHRDMDICFKDKHCVSTNRHLNIMFFSFQKALLRKNEALLSELQSYEPVIDNLKEQANTCKV